MDFLKYPRPQREKRLTLVAQWTDIEAKVCEAPYCKMLINDDLDINESIDCPVCGRNLCDACFGEQNAPIVWKEQANLICCQACSQLHPEERDALLALRVQFDQF